MKKSITTILAAIVLVCGSFQADAQQKKQQAQPKNETVVFATNLHCDKCVKKVNENISFEKGVKDLEVSLEKQTIKVTYDKDKTTKEKLAQAIKKLGYKAEESKK